MLLSTNSSSGALLQWTLGLVSVKSVISRVSGFIRLTSRVRGFSELLISTYRRLKFSILPSLTQLYLRDLAFIYRHLAFTWILLTDT